MIQEPVGDFFTQDELIAIYQKAGSAQETALQAAARELFPERMAAPEPPMLLVEEGPHGRSFCRTPDRQVAEAPKYTIKSGRCNWVAIMEDGEALKY